MHSLFGKSAIKGLCFAIGVVLMFASSACLGIGGAMYAGSRYLERSGVEVEATVDKIEDGNVFITYDVDGTAYGGTLQCNIRTVQEGDKVDIRYDAANPGMVQSVREAQKAPSLIAAGLALLAGGGILLVCGIRMNVDE